MKFNTSAHSVYNLKAHIIFVVAYRRKAITQKILVRLEEIFQEVCSHYNTHLIEFPGEADHVHLLIEYSPVVRLADLIRVLKSVSSQKIRAEYSCTPQICISGHRGAKNGLLYGRLSQLVKLPPKILHLELQPPSELTRCVLMEAAQS